MNTSLINLIVRALLFAITILFNSCSNEEEPKATDPNQAILGRWEEIENSLGSVKPSGYDEYLPDSIKIFYNYSDGISHREKYWFQDSILIRSFKYMDSYDTVVFKLPYKYKFISKDRLRLDFQYPAIVNWYIYKRIK